MKLDQVLYEIFESDVITLEDAGDAPAHSIDREIHLRFADDAPDLYLSWHPHAERRWLFYIDVAETTHFEVRDCITKDMSQHPLWRPLIGTDVEVQHTDWDRQVLVVKNVSRSVFCCSFEDGRWGADAIFVTDSEDLIGQQGTGGYKG